MVGCARSGGHVVRVVMLQGAVSNMVFKLLLALSLTYIAVANISLLGLTVSAVVVLSMAVTVSFHYCGTGMGEIGLAIRGASDYVVNNIWSHAIWTPCFKKINLNVDVICFTEKGR